MYRLANKILLSCPPEMAHQCAIKGLRVAQCLGLTRMRAANIANSPVEVMGIRFPNRVGLAAGFDKNGECIDALASLGFGHLEVGTVTPRPQPGNPKPRLFRIPEKRAVINRMGFNNHGVDALLRNIRRARFQGVLGINIGKNRDTPLEDAHKDYRHCLQKVYPWAHYVTVNVSSPNTPGLRDLQSGDSLKELLEILKKEQALLSKEHGKKVPIAVKISPDMAENDLRTLARQLIRFDMDGVIATNTTLDRSRVQGLPHAEESGGLSGEPLQQASTATIGILADELAGKLPVIGVGGISDLPSAAEKIAAGASLLQIYTGFIYRGPALIKEIVEGLQPTVP
jgi:dihydroorotate dehydrogenase